MTEREAYVAFNLTDQIGSVTVAGLVAKFGGVVDAWDAYPKKVARSGGEIDIAREFALAKRYGITILTPVDDGYPAQLKAIPGHPLTLYVKGDVKALSRPSIAIVGTRRATAYGTDNAWRFGHDLAARGWCVVSGLALGIDAEAHRGALEAGGITVGVIGSALDAFYPEENRALAREIVEKGGAVVSEFPFGRSADQHTFPQRNHVVAGMSRAVLAIEAPFKSGALITTSIAADLGRTVMALPGRIDSRSSAGCLALIRDGAVLVRDVRDVEQEMGELLPREMKPVQGSTRGRRAPSTDDAPAFTLDEAIIMRSVDADGISIDALVSETGFPAGKVNALCMSLRLKGRLRFFPGNRVALPRSE